MKALVLTGNKPDPISIQEMTLPALQAGEVRVRVLAAALNRRDQWIRVGKYPGIKEGTILGSDGCGIVEQVGDSSLEHWLGKEVVINPNIGWGPDPMVQAADYHILGMPTHGTFAEYVQVKADRLHEKPAHLSAEEAAAMPLGGLTAFRAVFTHGGLHGGKDILVTGIGGGVSQFAFQYGIAVGAGVYVTSGDDEKLAKAQELGVHKGFNYREEGWTKAAAKERGGFDVIVDSAGGKQFGDLVKMLKPGGVLVFYGASNGLPEGIDLFRMFWNQSRIQGSTMGNDREFEDMLTFASAQTLRPIIDSVTPFADAVSAFDKMAQGKQFGKLVLKMG